MQRNIMFVNIINSEKTTSDPEAVKKIKELLSDVSDKLKLNMQRGF